MTTANNKRNKMVIKPPTENSQNFSAKGEGHTGKNSQSVPAQVLEYLAEINTTTMHSTVKIAEV